ncbi:MAG TPA: iron-sulfur cluster assembly protein [Terriglobales bacterium]|nr:iron-sulfur cluster assembly protein [Terriglobales bacterium]
MSATSAAASLREAVTAALDAVTDPELDRSLVELGFAGAAVDGAGHVTVELRLPTFWCAPNFAYLMVQDAHDAVARVPGVASVSVRLVDHFAGEEISSGVAGGRSFDDAFDEAADGGGLDPLRRLFHVKAFTSRQEPLLRRLLREGRTPAEVARMRVSDLDEAHAGGREYLDKRRRLGLSVDPAAPLAVRPNGLPIAAEELVPYLDRARVIRVSVEANTAFCSSMLATRYGKAELKE